MNTVVESLNAWGSNFIRFAWPMLLQSGVVMAVLLGLNWALRRHVRAVVRYAVLLLMLVKLVLPTSFALPTGAGNWLSLGRTALAELPAEVSARPETVVPAEGLLPRPDWAPVRTPISSAPPARPSLSWQAMLLVSWVAGMVVLMGLVVRRFRGVARWVARAEEAPAELQDVLESCRAKLAVRQPVVLKFSAFPSSPAVCGLRRPVILVPKALAESLAAEQLQAVLLHELGHLKRGDLWVSHLQTLLQILYWYHPVLWPGNAILRQVREEAVDELVMVTMAAEAGAYPGTLLAVAKLGCLRRLSGLGLAGIAESHRGLKERIRKLVSRPMPQTAKLGGLGGLIFVLLASVVLPLARSATAPLAPPSPGGAAIEVQGFVTKVDSRGKETRRCNFSIIVSSTNHLASVVYFNGESFVSGSDGLDSYLLNEMGPAQERNQGARQLGTISDSPFPKKALTPIQLVWLAYASAPFLARTNRPFALECFQEQRGLMTNVIVPLASPPGLPAQIRWWAPNWFCQGTNRLWLAAYPNGFLSGQYLGRTWTNFLGLTVPLTWEFSSFNPRPGAKPTRPEDVLRANTLRGTTTNLIASGYAGDFLPAMAGSQVSLTEGRFEDELGVSFGLAMRTNGWPKRDHPAVAAALQTHRQNRRERSP